MTTILAPAENLARVHGRGSLLSILEKKVLLTRLKVVRDGRFIAETKDWSSYWEPLHKLGHREVEDSLNALHSVTIQNMTKALGLTGNHAYVAWSKTGAAAPHFSGERIS